MEILKKTTTLLVSMFISGYVLAQYVVRPEEMQTKSYQTIVKKKDRYFQLLAQQVGDSVLNAEGSEYNEYRKWKLTWEPRISAFGSFEDYLEYEKSMFGKSNSACNPTSINTNPWHEIGPLYQPLGPDSVSNGGSASGTGPVEQLVFAPSNPLTMVVASHTGGVFHTHDGGDHWHQSGSDAWPQSGSNSVDIHPNNSNTWLATSVAPSSGWVGYIGGIQRTLNGGSSWELIGNHTDFGIWTSFTGIKFDPINPNIAYAVSNNGIYKTSNALAAATSVTWSHLPMQVPSSIITDPTYFGYDFLSSPYHRVYDFELRPIDQSNPTSSSLEMYAAVEFRDATNSVYVWRLMKSVDEGITWNEITTPTNIDNVGSITIEVTKANRDLVTILHRPTGVVQRFDESIPNWTTMIPSLPTITFGGGQTFGISQHDPDILYIGKLDRYVVYDNGVINDYETNDGNKYQYHVDVEDMVAHPNNPNEVWMTNHGGVAKSIDNGQTWETKINGLNVTEVLDMMSGRTNASKLLISTYHDGSSITVTNHSNNWTPDWHHVYFGDGFTPLIDRTDDQYMWTNGNYKQSYSDQFGADNTFQLQNYGNGWGSCMGQHASDPATIFWARDPDEYAPNNDGSLETEIRRSFDRGDSFDVISSFTSHPDIDANADNWGVFEIEEARTNDNYLYALVFDALSNGPPYYKHYLFRTTQVNESAPVVANSWELLPIPYVEDRWIADIEVDPENENIVYLVYSQGAGGGVIFENDGCASEMVYRIDYSDLNNVITEDITYNLPATNSGACNTSHELLSLEQGSNGGMYLGTRTGAYYMNNNTIADGTYWRKFGTNLPHTIVSGMEIAYDVNKVRMSFEGRGVWEHGLQCPENANYFLNGTHSDFYYEASNKILSDATVPASTDVKYRAGRFVYMGPGFQAKPNSVFHAFIHPCDIPGNSFKMLNDNGNSEYEDADIVNVTEYGLKLYPNPNNGLFTVEVDESFKEEYSLIVFSLSGKIIWKKEHISTSKEEINLQNYPEGMYIIQFQSGNDILYNKIIKE